MEAASSGHKDVVQALIQAGAEVNLKSNFGKTALILAVGKGHRKIINALLKAKADCNLATLGGRTALMEAARSGCSEGARGLIEAKADVDFKSSSGETALFFAAKRGHQGIVDMLLEANADCNVATRQGRTALMEAAEAGREDIVGTLVAAKADVNQSDATGTAALMIAVRKGYRSIVEFLVGLDDTRLDIADENGRTALTLSHLGDKPTGVDAINLPKAGAEFPNAIRQKVSSMTLLLLSHGAREGWDGAELILATRARDTQRVQQLAQDDTVHVRDLEGRTGLLIACSKGDFKSVDALLKAKANPGIQSHDGRTSLMEAARGAHPKIVGLILGLVRNVNARDDNDDTALIHAARGGSAEILKQLVGADADLGAWNRDGRTALMEAAERGREAALAELLVQVEQRIEQPEARLVLINAVDGKGHSALDLAIAGEHSQCADSLRDHGAKTGAEAGLIVYVTPSGKCYHRRDCSTATQAREGHALTPYPVYDAVIQGYDACAVCTPGVAPVSDLPILPPAGSEPPSLSPRPFRLQIARLSESEFDVRASGTPMGEPSDTGALPYDSTDLVAVLRVLENRGYHPDRFTLAQTEALQRLGLLREAEPIPVLPDRWLRRIGQDLYQALFPGKVGTAFQMAYNQALAEKEAVPLQLRLDEDTVELARYPWELMHNDQRHLLSGGLVELTRYITYAEPPPSLEVSPPWRLLFIAPRPRDLGTLPADTERLAVWNGLQELTEEGELKLDQLAPPTYDALLYRTEKADYYHIIHFDGHGVFARRCPKPKCAEMNYPNATACRSCETPLDDVMPMGYLAFEGKGGKARFVSTKEIEDLLLRRKIHLVLLSACQSSVVQGESLFSGVGPGLIHAGVPAVVAMQFSVPVKAAVDFATGFYGALAKGETVPRAVALGRRRLFQHKAWYIPTLYLRSTDDEGRLFVR